ncbi:MAG: hypothetical protein ACRCZI_01075 [Cetobacterium sp.]
MFDFKDFLSTHLEHINLAVLIVILILTIISMATGSPASNALQIILTTVAIAANVARKYSQLMTLPGSGEEKSELIV